MDIGDLLGGRDLSDVKKAVGFVMENSDDFERILKLVRGVPDDALGYIGRLPELMNSARDKLKDAAGMLAGLAGELDKIPGIGDAAAKRLNDGSGMIGDVASEIESLAGNLRDLSGILANVGEALAGLGTKLTQSAAP
ncbi:hypothetical protein [Kribbella sp. VKM Ac-2568]|uniref:hypothetical protein n=1 Tax=Kribbella sp. VKM Ac-2568 TaxID=2512219 RepID=UPI0010EAB867|nr:hypothetical protein [Kribbella sp. VKM Ac-2568]TCM49394.1 hypothetical protein EV648_103668 [Kribbella sp. VKM Ac-2568]